ncbi:hypothetical protein [Plasticicumulans sp.]|uniref:hypothetical protein n=1 Tax=Plasticicumulans sp. TaxID=2307179 RepID=UPI002B546567|nr:hypothetical protein [Plasticicumulans sp.]MBS0601409.1 hypothetical protein [Pseudomonadota bacterium]HMW30728.1 hypothetical protein [Plasticicumulans sp.]HNE00239.1 hypothetical protein [Plasticicumulans sp.]HNF66633.1 hypothetical protein [Plasticicumulans sp.]HNG51253.1 hypothetical protein [Plasticicumulans sp.]
MQTVTAQEDLRLRAALEVQRYRLGRSLRGCAAAALTGLLLALGGLHEDRLPTPLALGFLVTLGGFASLGALLLQRRFARLARVVPRLRATPCLALLAVGGWFQEPEYQADVRIPGLWHWHVDLETPLPDPHLEAGGDQPIDAIAWLEPRRHRLWALELRTVVFWVRRCVRVEPATRRA